MCESKLAAWRPGLDNETKPLSLSQSLSSEFKLESSVLNNNSLLSSSIADASYAGRLVKQL